MCSTSISYSTRFLGLKSATSTPPPPPTVVRFRPSPRISSAYATVERPHSFSPSAASFYEVLGIQAGATCQDIKTAYRRLARVLHPDAAPSSRSGEPASADQFIRIHAAYSTLYDPDKRADYDRTLYRRRRSASPSFEVSPPRSVSSFSRRSWETDQCW